MTLLSGKGLGGIIHRKSSVSSTIASILAESLSPGIINLGKLVNIQFDSPIGVDINSISNNTLDADTATVTLVDKLAIENGGVVATFNVLGVTAGNYSLDVVGNEVLDTQGAVGTDTNLGTLVLSDSPVASIPTSTAMPELTSATLGTNIPVALELTHSSGINQSTLNNSSLEIVDEITGNTTGTVTFVNATDVMGTVTANFLFNIPSDGRYRLQIPQDGFRSANGEQAIEQTISTLYSNLEGPIWPREGNLTFSDKVSREVFFQYGGRCTGGSGKIDSAVQPNLSEIRGNCERYRITNTDHSFAYQRFNFRTLSIGQDPSPFEGNSYFPGQTLFKVRMMVSKLPTSGNLEVIRLIQSNAAGNYSSIRITPAGEVLHFRDETQVSVTGNFITENTWFNVGFDTNPADRSHQILFRLDSASTWESLANFGVYYNSSGGQINQLRYGIVSRGTSNTGEDVEVYVDTLLSSATNDQAVLDQLQYLAGSGCRDRTTDKARIALVYADGLFRNATHAQVRYSTDSNLASGVLTTPTVNLADAEYHNSRWTLESLSAGTNYYYQFDILDKDSNVIYTSDTYRFRTLATDNSSFSMLVSGCITPGAYARSYVPLSPVASYAESATDWVGFECTGDFTYADTGNAEDPWQFPAEDVVNFEHVIRQVCTDRFLHRIFKAGMVFSMADDHVVTNNIDAQYSPGNALENRVPSQIPNLVPVYTDNITVGELWTRGYSVFNAWFSGQQLEPASPGALYGATNFGDTRILRVDARYERREDLNQYVSPTQFQWLKDEITNFGASSQTILHIFCNNSWAIEGSKDSEGWERIALAEYQELMEHIYTVVPSTKRVLVNSGDNHKGYAFHNYSYRNGQVGTAVNPFVGEIISAGITNTFHNNPISATYRILEYSQSGVGGRDLIKVSGTLYEQAANTAGLNVKIWNANTLEVDQQIFSRS